MLRKRPDEDRCHVIQESQTFTEAFESQSDALLSTITIKPTRSEMLGPGSEKCWVLVPFVNSSPENWSKKDPHDDTMVVPGVIFPRGGKIFQNVIKKLNGKTQLVPKKTMLQLGPPDKHVAYGVSQT
jgi:hypothetical protein